MTAALFVPEIALPHAQALFMEIMDFLDEDLGLIDFIPDAERGGDMIERPRVGQLGSDFGRANIAGTQTDPATAANTTNTNERAVILHRTLLHEFFWSTMDRSGFTPQSYSEEIGRQMAVKAGQRLLDDIYNANLAAAASVVGDHEHDVYVDTVTAGSQVDFIPNTLQGAKFLLGDHMENIDVGVCNSKQWNDMRIDLISNDDFRVPNIVGDVIRGNLFRTVLGVTFIVDDQIPTSAGPTTSSPTRQRALLFRSRNRNPAGEAPLTLSFQRPLTIHNQFVLGGQSRREQLHAEMSYALGIRGKQWDSATVSENPTDAQLATSTNWDDSFDDLRQHGVIAVLTN